MTFFCKLKKCKTMSLFRFFVLASVLWCLSSDFAKFQQKNENFKAHAPCVEAVELDDLNKKYVINSYVLVFKILEKVLFHSSLPQGCQPYFRRNKIHILEQGFDNICNISI